MSHISCHLCNRQAIDGFVCTNKVVEGTVTMMLRLERDCANAYIALIVFAIHLMLMWKNW